jgi:hypothetical protein
MRLPGTRYQEPGWEQVRKLLGQCSLAMRSRCDPARLLARRAMRCWPCTSTCWPSAARGQPQRARPGARQQLRRQRARTGAGLVYELQARPADWEAFARRVAASCAPALAPPAKRCCARRSTTCSPSCATRSTPTTTRPPAAALQPEPHLRLPHARYRLWRDRAPVRRLARAPRPGRRHPRARRSTARCRSRCASCASIAGCRPNGSCAGARPWSASRARRAPAHALEALRQPEGQCRKDRRHAARDRRIRGLSANRDRDWLQDRDDAGCLDGGLLARAAGVERRRRPGRT